MAQIYFAVQARRQELTDQLAADVERLELRKHTGEDFKSISGSAKQTGVENQMFGVFHDAGCKGLYGGLGRDTIKTRKGVPEKENLMDRMTATELAANQFRMPKLVTSSRVRASKVSSWRYVPTSKWARKSATPSRESAVTCPNTSRRQSTSRKWRTGSKPRRPSWNSMNAMRAACWAMPATKPKISEAAP